MLHFRMDMPFYLMAFYGSIMIGVVLLLRALLKNRLPKFVFPAFWAVVLLRLLVPFSVSSPLSLPVPKSSFFEELFSAELLANEATTHVNHLDEVIFLREGSGSAQEQGDTVDIEGTYTNIVEEAGTEYTVYAGYGNNTRFWLSLGNVLPAIYLLGLAAVAAILAWQKYSYMKKLRTGLLMEQNGTVNELLRSMDMGHVLVFTNDEIASPLVCGLLRPRIYLPTRMDFGNTVLLRHVLAHETMHIKRRDNFVKAIMLVVLVLNWYNPLVWIMAKCLAQDIEAACDAAVLGQCDEDERKGYAFSLLAMAVSGGRASLLYSAFSRTEVEKRVKGVLHYKKATVFALLFSLLFVAGGTVVFATGGQAPFSNYLTSYCASSSSKWGVRVEITRDISLGKNPQKRAEDAVFDVLRADTTGDPDIIREAIKAALAEEFGVERGAFEPRVSLCLDSEEVNAEYAGWGITRKEDGFLLYQGQQVRIYRDEMLGSYQSLAEGTVDIAVLRDRLGNITSVTVWREGDREYDKRTEDLGRFKLYDGPEINQGYAEEQ